MHIKSIAVAALLLTVAPATVLAGPSINPLDAPTGHYVLDQGHTSVTVSVLHMGLSHFTMRLRGVTGAYDYDPVHPEASTVSITLDATSLDAGDPTVSKKFAGEFLDAGKNPQITFVSTAIRPDQPGHGAVAGDLTFRGVTHPVMLDVTYNGASSGLIGGRRMGFSATAVVRRSEFGSRAWLGQVGDDARIVIETEFVRR